MDHELNNMYKYKYHIIYLFVDTLLQYLMCPRYQGCGPFGCETGFLESPNPAGQQFCNPLQGMLKLHP